MKLDNFNYQFIKTFNANIRVSKFRLEKNVETNQLVEIYDYKNKQAILDHSDVEDMFENIGAVANEVTIFDNPDHEKDYLTKTELNHSRQSIEKAINYLLKSYPYKQFKEQFIQTIPTNDESITYQRFIFRDDIEKVVDNYEITIVFDSDLYATKPFFPIKPGAVVNHFTVIKY